MEDIFLGQIGKTFDAMMKQQPNNPRTRCKVYAELTRIFPEGIFKGFTYPNLKNHEDYTLRVLSGKRRETGSISVYESSEPNGSNEEEVDLGSEADTDNEEKQYEESAVSHWGNTLSLFLPNCFLHLEPHSWQPGRVVPVARETQGKPGYNAKKAQEPKAEERTRLPAVATAPQPECGLARGHTRSVA